MRLRQRQPFRPHPLILTRNRETTVLKNVLSCHQRAYTALTYPLWQRNASETWMFIKAKKDKSNVFEKLVVKRFIL